MDAALFPQAQADERLTALRRLVQSTPTPKRFGTNLHVHSGHSFSAFSTPTEVVWAGVEAGIEILGLNDFFTVAGYQEFQRACAAAQMPGIVCVECIAMDAAAETAGLRLNDPTNPGRLYLCAKAITEPGNQKAESFLSGLRTHQEARNRAMVTKLDGYFRSRLNRPGPTWDDVVRFTPLGNTTERHVALAALRALGRSEDSGFATAFVALTGVPAEGDDARLQDLVRSHLLKAGKPGFVPEERQAFPTVADLLGCFLALGAVPVYPILGDPETEGEADISALFDRIDAWGFRAVEVIPARNRETRLLAILAEAKRRQWPLTDGTEHNTATRGPMTSPYGLDERFRTTFREGALVLLGHQSLGRKGIEGYLGPSGTVRPGAYGTCLAEGRKALDAVRRSTLVM